jgi:uncharacterized protein YwqG
MDLEEIKAQLKRRASQIIVGGFRPPEQPEVSWFGRVHLAQAHESWPMHAGKPMIPLCQLNLTEAPYVPPNLKDIALLTIFISADTLPLDTPKGEGWELRAYASLENLTEIAEPDHGSRIRPFPIRWELIEEDYPSWEDVAIALPKAIEDNYYDLFEVKNCSKIGGWPSLIQSEIYWAPFNRHPANPQYAFQIASEEKAHWMWGDAGVGYFGRGTGQASNTWTLAWQCY